MEQYVTFFFFFFFVFAFTYCYEPGEEHAENEGGDEIPPQVLDDGGRRAGVAERRGGFADKLERQQDQ